LEKVFDGWEVRDAASTTKLSRFDASGGGRDLDGPVNRFPSGDASRVRAVEYVATPGGVHDFHLKGSQVLHTAAAFRVPTALLSRGHHAASSVVPGKGTHHRHWFVFSGHSLGQLDADDQMIYLVYQVQRARVAVRFDVTDYGYFVDAS
jgi:hypothetical protein